MTEPCRDLLASVAAFEREHGEVPERVVVSPTDAAAADEASPHVPSVVFEVDPEFQPGARLLIQRDPLSIA